MSHKTTRKYEFEQFVIPNKGIYLDSIWLNIWNSDHFHKIPTSWHVELHKANQLKITSNLELLPKVNFKFCFEYGEMLSSLSWYFVDMHVRQRWTPITVQFCNI